MNKQLSQLRDFASACDKAGMFLGSLTDIPLEGVDAYTQTLCDLTNLRIKLIDEEFLELVESLEEGSTEEVLKEMCDLLYVIFGTATAYGLDKILPEAFDRVHHNNLLKLERGTVREDGKLVKALDHPKVFLGDLIDR